MDQKKFQIATVLSNQIDTIKRQLSDWEDLDSAKGDFSYSVFKFALKNGIEYNIQIDKEILPSIKKIALEQLQIKLTDLENKFKAL